MKTRARATVWPMRLAALLVLVVSAPAAAAPCSVTIARAPDGVREVIDHWVGAEPHCTAALEVRIVETEGGLYVIARDDRGRLRDRIVPDAQTAGVLVASWAADDAVPPWTPGSATVTAPALHVEPTPIVASPRPLTAEDLAAQGRVDRPGGIGGRASERHWIRLGLEDGLANGGIGNSDVGSQSARGLRGSVGVWSRGPWTLDVSVDLIDVRPVTLYPPDGLIAIRAYNAFADFGYVFRTGRASLTPSVGAGVRYATFDEDMIQDLQTPVPFEVHTHDVMLAAQATALGALEITPRVQLTMQLSALFHHDPWGVEENMELMWIGGVGVAM